MELTITTSQTQMDQPMLIYYEDGHKSFVRFDGNSSTLLWQTLIKILETSEFRGDRVSKIETVFPKCNEKMFTFTKNENPNCFAKNHRIALSNGFTPDMIPNEILYNFSFSNV